MTAGDPSLSAFPEGDNIFQWTGTITGGAGTVCCAERCFGAARTGAAAAAYAGSSPPLAAAAAAAGCRRCWLPPPPPPPPPLLPGYDTAATTMGGHQPLTMPTVAAAAAMRTPCVLVPCSCRTAALPALLATMRADLASLPAIRSQVYEGLTFKLLLKFPTSYPFEAPQVTFSTPCFHPNVDQYGNICLGAQPSEALPPTPPPPHSPIPPARSREPVRSLLLTRVPASCLAALSDILKEKWSAVYNVRTILLSIQSLLGDPNLDSPLNGHAASIWHNVPEYKKALLKHKSAHTAEPRRP